MEEGRIPGLTIAVAVDDEVVWSEGFGLANLEANSPATPASRFRIASLSKNLTGTAVALLVEQGRLDLDRPVHEYLPDLPDSWRGMTTRHLVTHTSGITHYISEEDAQDLTFYATTRDALARFTDRPLAHPPGEKETYSSYAYTVVAAVIEAVTERDFLGFIQEALFAPLGMTRTGPDLSTAIIHGRTGFYEYGPDRQVRPATRLDLSGRWAGSGFLSTAEDLARFGVAHTRPGFLAQSTLEMIAARQPLPGGGFTKEGMGWGPREDWDGRSSIWGNGITPGATGGLIVYPSRRLTVALLSNIRHAPIDRGEFQMLARRFLAAIEGSPAAALPKSWYGRYDIKAASGDTVLRGTLDVSFVGGRPGGSLRFQGWQEFRIADGFLIGEEAWIVGVNGESGVMPLRVRRSGDEIAGDAPRIGFTLKGRRSSEPGPS